LSVDCTGTKACLARLVKSLQLSGVILVSTLQASVRLAGKQSSQLLCFSYTNLKSLFHDLSVKRSPGRCLRGHWELKLDPEMVSLLQVELV